MELKTSEVKQEIKGPPEGLEVDFFYVQHHPGNIGKIWKKIKDYDIFLVEVYGGSEAHRKSWDELVNTISSIKNPKARIQEVKRNLDGNEFLDILRRKIALRGKVIQSIDVVGDHKAIEFDKESEKEMEQVATYTGYGLMTTAYQHFRLGIIAGTQSIVSRDYEVAGQVEDIVTKTGDALKGKKICVIQGRAHRRTYRIFKKHMPEVKSRKRFMEPLEIFPTQLEIGERVVSSSYTDRENLIRKQFVGSLFIFPELIRQGISPLESLDKSSEEIRKLDDQKVSEVFRRFSVLEQTTTSMLSGVRVPDENENQSRLDKIYIFAHKELESIRKEYFGG